jgi:hypothetical protein
LAFGAEQVLWVALVGARYAARCRGLHDDAVGAVTLPVALFERLTEHDLTAAAERSFLADTESIDFGPRVG